MVYFDGSETTEILNRKIEADKEVVKAMICDFITQAKSKNLNVKSNNVAFDFYDNCLMVWLEVDDKQEETKYKEIENELNEKFRITGFRIAATIVGDWRGYHPTNYTSIHA